jgi:hypothetical protein
MNVLYIDRNDYSFPLLDNFKKYYPDIESVEFFSAYSLQDALQIAQEKNLI